MILRRRHGDEQRAAGGLGWDGRCPLEIPALGGFAVGQTQKRELFRAVFEFFGVVGLTQRSYTAQLQCRTGLRSRYHGLQASAGQAVCAGLPHTARRLAGWRPGAEEGPHTTYRTGLASKV